jgi:2-dehydropantoate 2-reductase
MKNEDDHDNHDDHDATMYLCNERTTHISQQSVDSSTIPAKLQHYNSEQCMWRTMARKRSSCELTRHLSSSSSTPLDFSEPIHILGAGSIGLLWAASIRGVFPSYPLQILLREHHQHRLVAGSSRTKSIAICLQQQQQSSRNSNNTRLRSRVVQVPASIVSDKGSTIRNLLLTTKAFQAQDALDSVRHRIDPESTRLIVLCNGALGVRRDQQGQFRHLHLALTTHGAYRDTNDDDDDDDELFHVVHAGQGRTQIENYETMARLWDMAGLNCESIPNLEQALWYKLAANCVINPLTALHQCTNGELLELPNFESQMNDILREVAAAAQANDQSLLLVSNDRMIQQLQENVLQIIHETANNKSSMLQDVLAQRQTEIDFLNGYIVQACKRHGLSCPANQELVKRIQELRQKESWVG